MSGPAEFVIDEKRHIDVLVQANRQLLGRINELKAAGNDLAKLLEGQNGLPVEAESVVATWRHACRN